MVLVGHLAHQGSGLERQGASLKGNFIGTNASAIVSCWIEVCFNSVLIVGAQYVFVGGRGVTQPRKLAYSGGERLVD